MLALPLVPTRVYVVCTFYTGKGRAQGLRSLLERMLEYIRNTLWPSAVRCAVKGRDMATTSATPTM